MRLDDQATALNLITRATYVQCTRLRGWPDGPTCRSPIKGEGLPRRNWCLYCDSREFLEQLKKQPNARVG